MGTDEYDHQYQLPVPHPTVDLTDKTYIIFRDGNYLYLFVSKTTTEVNYFTIKIWQTGTIEGLIRHTVFKPSADSTTYVIYDKYKFDLVSYTWSTIDTTANSSLILTSTSKLLYTTDIIYWVQHDVYTDNGIYFNPTTFEEPQTVGLYAQMINLIGEPPTEQSKSYLYAGCIGLIWLVCFALLKVASWIYAKY